MSSLSQRRARELLCLYFVIESLHRKLAPFGGPYLPRLLHLRNVVRRRLEEWSGYDERE